MSTAPILLWLRNDLRFEDNSALAAAIRKGTSILPVFVWDPQSHGRWEPGGASKWWLHRALEDFSEGWKAKGGQLILRKGDSLTELHRLIEETGATRIFWNRRYEPRLREADAKIRQVLEQEGLEVRSCNASLLNEPDEVMNKAGNPFRVYTPYFNAVRARFLPEPVVPDWSALRFSARFPISEPLESLGLLPNIPWFRGLESRWQPSEAGAIQCLQRFLKQGVDTYAVERDRPDHAGTSSLSPYLHFGQIGPRQVMASLKARCDLRAKDPEVFLKELYWREFAYHILYHFPETPEAPLQSRYADFPWKADARMLRLWEQGKTGYPVVDAGMHQLFQTGWMHNRVRMIVASFLVKHLLQDWKHGARWFWDTLVDADLASNTLGWQWSGGCGADAAPYFRVFNPLIQGPKFDPEGHYVKHYLPQLSQLPAKYVHAPWEAPSEVLKKAEVVLGEHYPEPLVDHRAARKRALDAFDHFKNGGTSQ